MRGGAGLAWKIKKRPAGTVPCGSFGGPLTKSVHAITENGNPSLMKQSLEVSARGVVAGPKW
jgi:hypothetical protein